MSSTTGLRTGNFDDVSIAHNISLTTSANDGTAGQVIVSGGADQPVEWGHGHGLNHALTAGTNLTLASGAGSWDATTADTLNATNTTYSAGDGLDLTGTTFSADLKSGSGLVITSGEIDLSSIPNSALANSTISGVSLGSNLFNLTAGTDIQFVSGSGPVATYNASEAITINSTATDTTYAGGNNISIDTSANPDEIDLDAAITGMTGITYTGGGTTLTGGGGAGDETAATYIDLTSATNLMPLLYPEKVKPYLVFDVYDPSSLDTDSLTTSYAQIFSGNLSNSFTAKTTSVEVQLQIFNSSSSGNRWFYLRLSDGSGNEWSGGGGTGGGSGTGTRNTERLIHYADEHDRQTIVMSWYLEGLSIGSSYTINPYAKTSSTYNNIYAGGSYPACILKVINL